ncbi:hypothetical protein LPJ53_004839 [Coemansia erecta]|uniref:Uncharacterized protein n=1 Tax=Coemansia erecta TaxID=147472 RepID=A0A9W8CQW8_9FUNG|nr:hypothetical protein LPJ53_004839 [Coemansia erecta]
MCSRGHSMMAPAVDDDESVNWADFSSFGSSTSGQGAHSMAAVASDDVEDHNGEYSEWHGSFIPIVSPKTAAAAVVTTSAPTASEGKGEGEVGNLPEKSEEPSDQ